MSLYNYTKISPSECQFYRIAAVEELPSGERLYLEIDDQAIVVFNIAGNLYAIGDVCTHDDGPLGDGQVEGFEITCPRHGARFDIRTGKALAFPAVIDTPAYPVRIVDNQIEIGIPHDE